MRRFLYCNSGVTGSLVIAGSGVQTSLTAVVPGFISQKHPR